MKKLLVLLAVIGFGILFSSTVHARAEGFYIGGGYNQPLMYTWEKQGDFTQVNPGDSITFFPAFGAFLMGGYEFHRPDWFGLALSVNWGMVRLNKAEWVQLFSPDAEALFHMLDPESKWDPYIAGLMGMNYMTEGKIQNGSKSWGPEFGIAFGLKYTLSEYARAGSSNIKNLSLMFEVPVKIMLFMNDRDLANTGTTPVLAFPVKIGLTYTF